MPRPSAKPAPPLVQHCPCTFGRSFATVPSSLGALGEPADLTDAADLTEAPEATRGGVVTAVTGVMTASAYLALTT